MSSDGKSPQSPSHSETSPSNFTLNLPKKPKGKLFQCTGYPGCSMVFTRSEHLARHIRKHTGERPFQCDYCMKKFSRLDNLRQHKQAVHQFENINNYNNTHTRNSGKNNNNGSNNNSNNSNSNNKNNKHLPKSKINKLEFFNVRHSANKITNYQMNNHINYLHNHNPLNLTIQANNNTNKNNIKSNDLNLDDPKTPAITLNATNDKNIHTLLSPPNSVSPHVHIVQNSMLPPPRKNNLLTEKQGFSGIRSLSNKPVPIVITDSDQVNSSNITNPKLVTPSTGTASIVDISPAPSRVNQLQLQSHIQGKGKLQPSQSPSLQLFSTTSNFASPQVSPSVNVFPEATSPYVLNFNYHNQNNHQHLVQGGYSNISTPTTTNFAYPNNNPYLSPLYHQRIMHPQPDQQCKHQQTQQPSQDQVQNLTQSSHGNLEQQLDTSRPSPSQNRSYGMNNIHYTQINPMNSFPMNMTQMNPMNQINQMNQMKYMQMNHMQMSPMNQVQMNSLSSANTTHPAYSHSSIYNGNVPPLQQQPTLILKSETDPQPQLLPVPLQLSSAQSSIKEEIKSKHDGPQPPAKLSSEDNDSVKENSSTTTTTVSGFSTNTTATNETGRTGRGSISAGSPADKRLLLSNLLNE